MTVKIKNMLVFGTLALLVSVVLFFSLTIIDDEISFVDKNVFNVNSLVGDYREKVEQKLMHGEFIARETYKIPSDGIDVLSLDIYENGEMLASVTGTDKNNSPLDMKMHFSPITENNVLTGWSMTCCASGKSRSCGKCYTLPLTQKTLERNKK